MDDVTAFTDTCYTRCDVTFVLSKVTCMWIVSLSSLPFVTQGITWRSFLARWVACGWCHCHHCHLLHEVWRCSLHLDDITDVIATSTNAATCTHTHLQARTHAYIHTFACTHARTHARTRARTHARTYTQMYIVPNSITNLLGFVTHSTVHCAEDLFETGYWLRCVCVCRPLPEGKYEVRVTVNGKPVPEDLNCPNKKDDCFFEVRRPPRQQQTPPPPHPPRQLNSPICPPAKTILHLHSRLCIRPPIYPPTYASAHPFIHTPTYSSFHPSVNPPTCSSVHPSIYTSTRLCIHPPTYSSVHISIHPLIHWSNHPSTHLFIRLPIHPYIHPLMYPSTHLFIHPIIHPST